MKSLHKIAPRVALAALLATGGAIAHAEGLYVGGALGTPDYHSPINGIVGNGSGVGGKVFGGYQFNTYFGVEGGLYDLGHIDNGNGKVTTRGGYVDAVGTYPLASQWSLLGSAGFTEARLRTTYGDDSSPGLKLGAGLQYDLTRQVALRVQYDRYRFSSAFDDRANVGETTFGVKIGF
jgi:OOP family OmpA-OmpF porin